MKNPNIVAVRFIGLVNKAGFINEIATENHFITSLLESSGYNETLNKIELARKLSVVQGYFWVYLSKSIGEAFRLMILAL